MSKQLSTPYQGLLDTISQTFSQEQQRTVASINAGLVSTCWEIGQHIVEYEQQGQTTTEYGKQLLIQLSKDLKLKYGKGFSLSNIKRFRQFYLAFRNSATLSHYFELLKISNVSTPARVFTS